MLKNYDFVGNLKRALIISAAIMLVVTVLAAFAFSRLSFRGKDLVYLLLKKVQQKLFQILPVIYLAG